MAKFGLILWYSSFKLMLHRRKFTTVFWITVHEWQSRAVILYISPEYFLLDQVVGMYFIL